MKPRTDEEQKAYREGWEHGLKEGVKKYAWFNQDKIRCVGSPHIIPVVTLKEALESISSFFGC